MRQSLIECDRCKKAVKYEPPGPKPDDWARVGGIDLCPECSGALNDFFGGAALMSEKDRVKKGQLILPGPK